MIKKVLILFVILSLIVVLGYLEFLTYGTLYHTLGAISIISINFNIYTLSKNTANLHKTIKRWLQI